jgi:hypothetical protein
VRTDKQADNLCLQDSSLRERELFKGFYLIQAFNDHCHHLQEENIQQH